MKKNVLKPLLSASLSLLFITTNIKAQTTYSQIPECVDFDLGRYPLRISGIFQNGVGPQTVDFAWNPIWNFPNSLKQARITSINIGNTGLFRGLLQYLPASYSQPANSTKKYPVIIYFHGGASVGDGSIAQLCRLFKDRGTDLQTHVSIPGRVERNSGLFTQTYAGETQEYIVISPQFTAYTRLHPTLPDNFPTADHVEDVIDYVELNYRIDPRRIYLTGFSNGANMIAEYAASSVARAKRIAALMPVALCSRLDHIDNINRGYNGTYIGQAKLKTWFVYCEVDNCGQSGADYDVPVNWVNTIKAVPGHEPPRFTVLKNVNPPSLYNCSDTLTHDAWSRAYNPDFKASFINGTGANDGVNLNAYEWFARAQSAVLPVVLQSYSARLINDKVEIDWITSDEKDNKSFTIERAGPDQKFKAIGTVPGAIDNTGNKEYSFTDNGPLPGMSFYRLVQNDIDGEKTYFDIKKIINRNGKENAISVTPNPFSSELSAYISLSRAQKVFISVTDMTGKSVKSTSGIYGQGSSEIKFSTHDLSSGIYLFKVSGEDFTTTQKIVKK